MANASYTQVSNTVLSKNEVQPVLNQFTMRKELVADAATAAVNLLSGDYLYQAASTGLVVNNGANALTVGADTAANAKVIMDRFGLTRAGDGVLLRFYFLLDAVPQSIANTDATAANVGISVAGGAAATTAVAKVGGIAAAGSAEHALVWLSATTVTAGAEVVNFNILQQAI